MTDPEQNGSKHAPNLIRSNYFVNIILIFYFCFRIFALHHILVRFINNQQIVILPCTLVATHNDILSFLCVHV